jgi:hypothetical protein
LKNEKGTEREKNKIKKEKETIGTRQREGENERKDGKEMRAMNGTKCGGAFAFV